VDAPYLSVEDTGEVFTLESEITTVGRGDGIDVALTDPTVSRLHAELVRRGPYLYVSDLGLSSNGTRVNGRPVGRRLLADGDVVAFGGARCRVGGLDLKEAGESEVLTALCRPALSQEAFVAPATAREIADELVVTEAAVKQHLLRLYSKFRIPEGVGRRARLANEVISAGVVRPLPENNRAPGKDGDGGPGSIRRVG
jgi:hypothetical protein